MTCAQQNLGRNSSVGESEEALKVERALDLAWALKKCTTSRLDPARGNCLSTSPLTVQTQALVLSPA